MEITSFKIRYPKLEDDCILAKGVVRSLEEMREDEITFVEPCAAEVGRLMAKITLSDEKAQKQGLFFDKSMLCELFEAFKERFSEFECSKLLGIVRIKWRGKNISLFASGRIKISTALSEEDIMRMLHDITRLSWGAMICSVCGSPAIYCASGACNKCIIRQGDEAKEAFVSGKLPGLILTNALNQMDQAIKELEVNYERLLNRLIKQEKSDISLRAALKKTLKTAQLSLEYILRVSSPEDALAGFMVLGSSWNLRTVLEAVKCICEDMEAVCVFFQEVDRTLRDSLYSLLTGVNTVLSILSTGFMIFDREAGDSLERRIGLLKKRFQDFNRGSLETPKRQKVLDTLIHLIDSFLAFAHHLSKILGVESFDKGGRD